MIWTMLTAVLDRGQPGGSPEVAASSEAIAAAKQHVEKILQALI